MSSRTSTLDSGTYIIIFVVIAVIMCLFAACSKATEEQSSESLDPPVITQTRNSYPTPTTTTIVEMEQSPAATPVFMYAHPEGSPRDGRSSRYGGSIPAQSPMVVTLTAANAVGSVGVPTTTEGANNYNSTLLISRNSQTEIDMTSCGTEEEFDASMLLSPPPPAYVPLDSTLSRPNQVSTVYRGDDA